MKSLVALLLSLNLFVVALLPGADSHGLVDAATLWHHHDVDHAATGVWISTSTTTWATTTTARSTSHCPVTTLTSTRRVPSAFSPLRWWSYCR